jgi:hypothetical protein
MVELCRKLCVQMVELCRKLCVQMVDLMLETRNIPFKVGPQTGNVLLVAICSSNESLSASVRPSACSCVKCAFSRRAFVSFKVSKGAAVIAFFNRNARR